MNKGQMIMSNHRLGRVSEKIYRELLQDIETGIYKVNERFPTEKELCNRFSCSHCSIRKVMAKLIADDIIETQQGSGSYVKTSFYEQSSQSNIISVMFHGTMDLLSYLQRYTLDKGYILSVYSQHQNSWRPSAEIQFLNMVKKGRHKALLAICTPWEKYNLPILQDLENSGIPVIHYEYQFTDLPAENYILPDYHAAGYKGAVALLLAGYEKLVVMGDTDDPAFAKLQEAGFYQALHEHQQKPSERCDILTNPDYGNFYDAKLNKIFGRPDLLKQLKQFLSQQTGKLGIYCATTNRAKMMQRILAELKIEVPQQVGIISTEDLFAVRDLRDRMDYITFDRNLIFKKAVDACISPTFKGIHEIIPPIMVRNGKTVSMN